jgi:L-fuculose-phosphate aldolase
MSRVSPFLHPADEIMLTMERIYRHRMTTTSGGNLSLVDGDGRIWITPAGIDKGGLERDDIVCVGADGPGEGARRPSSELPFHRTIYAARPDIRGIVHAHAGALVAFSIAHRVPDTRLFHQSRSVCGEVGFAPYALPGSAELGERIAATFAQGFNCVVLENHGVVVGGPTLQLAFQRFETLEFAAHTLIRAGLIGEVRFLGDEDVALPPQLAALPAFTRPSPPSTAERDLRRLVCQFTRRGYRQRLFISTEGSYSARVGDDAFVITPNQADRDALEADDLVLVQGGQAEAGKLPSRASRLHRAIYRQHPWVGAIVNACPVNATAFSVTGADFDPRTIPESYIVLRHVGRVPYGVQFRDPRAVADDLSPTQPALLLENDGVMVAGRTVLEAFDRLEVMESTAEALINGRLLGDVQHMPGAAIDELTRVFIDV